MTFEAHPLEPTAAEFQTWVEVATPYLRRFLETLPEQSAWDESPTAEAMSERFEPLPENGKELGKLLSHLFEHCLANSFNPASPGYLAFIPGGGLPAAAIAELVANVINHYVTVWCAAPWLAQIELQVIRWFCDELELPETSGGFLTTGGSMANWCGLTTAREQAADFSFQRSVIYCSKQAHHCIGKGAKLAGIRQSNIRWIEVDEHQRIRVDKLEAAIAADRDCGMHPWLLVGQAGTTNTGAIDPLESLAEIAQREALWLHVDAAYGGFFQLTEEGREKLRGLHRADSIVLDPHKGLFLPFGTGCLLVRDQTHLRNTFSMTSDYMPPLQDAAEAVDFCEISPDLSRDFRGLRLWLPIKMSGIAPFRHALKEKLDLARLCFEALSEMKSEIDDRLWILPPQLSVVAFRLESPDLSIAAANALNQLLLREINASRRVFLTSTLLDGRFTLRIAILSFRTHQDRVQECLDLIRQALHKVGESD